MDGLRQIMADLLAPEKAAQATAQMKELKSNQMLLPALMQIALTDTEPQIRFIYIFVRFFISIEFLAPNFNTIFYDKKGNFFNYRQMAAVILRKETSKRFNSLGQADQAQLKEAVIKGFVLFNN